MNRVVRAHGAGQLRVTEAPAPSPGTGQVAIALGYAGICGSDLSGIAAAPAGRPPYVPGHELAGTVVATGPGVTRAAVGDRVVLLPRLPCHHCRACRAGAPVHCAQFRRPAEGGWADVFVRDEEYLVPVPAELPLRHAVLTEPLACCLRAVDRAELRPGERVLVLGGGSLGQLIAVVCQHSGAGAVTVSEPRPARRARAAALGVSVIDPSAVPVADWAARTGGVEVVVEAVGRAAVLSDAIAAAVRGGRVVVAGVAAAADTVAVAPWELFAKELSLRGAWGVETTFDRALALVPWLAPERLLEPVFDLAEAAAAVAAAGSTAAGKVLLRGAGGGE